jgi:hypothetical protein
MKLLRVLTVVCFLTMPQGCSSATSTAGAPVDPTREEFDPGAMRTCISREVVPFPQNPKPNFPAAPPGSNEPLTSGGVLVRFWVLPNGRVHMNSVEFPVIHGDGRFALAARQVLPRWRFQPAVGSASADSMDIDRSKAGSPCRPGVPETPVAAHVQMPIEFLAPPA